MLRQLQRKLTLNRLILLLAAITIIITLINAIYSTYKVQKDITVENLLLSNEHYSEKIANVTDMFIHVAQRKLRNSVNRLPPVFDDLAKLEKEVNYLFTHSDSFNSLIVVRADGTVLAATKSIEQLVGKRVTSRITQRALEEKRSFVSAPFTSPAGNYLVSMTEPIFSAKGEYLGYMGGAIYLHDNTVFSELFGLKTNSDPTVVYVTDADGTILYHPEATKVGMQGLESTDIDKLKDKTSASLIMYDESAILLSGVAAVSTTGWKVVTTISQDDAMLQLNERTQQAIVSLLPIEVIIIVGVWLASWYISSPLWMLSSLVRNLDKEEVTLSEFRKIRPWYEEAGSLKSAFLSTFNVMSNTIKVLHDEAHEDPMTKLLNRRGLDDALHLFESQSLPFAVLALDIDHFKRVNDTFGHDIGDEVIKKIAAILSQQARDGDCICRAGGEEFLVLIPFVTSNTALKVAERIRITIASTNFDTAGTVTVSIGVASRFESESTTAMSVLKRADTALYSAKANGRNRTEVVASH